VAKCRLTGAILLIIKLALSMEDEDDDQSAEVVISDRSEKRSTKRA